MDCAVNKVARGIVVAVHDFGPEQLLLMEPNRLEELDRLECKEKRNGYKVSF